MNCLIEIFKVGASVCSEEGLDVLRKRAQELFDSRNGANKAQCTMSFPWQTPIGPQANPATTLMGLWHWVC